MDTVRAKQRSPNYPAVDLGTAVENARKLWGIAGRRRVSQEDAVRTWGYGSLSGPARSRLAALRQYGLVDVDRDGDVGLTRRGQLLAFGADPSSSDYDVALKEAALAPEIFRELYDTRRVASDESIRRHLVLDRKYSEDGARKLIESFRSSLALAKLDDESYDEDMNGAGATQGHDQRPSAAVQGGTGSAYVHATPGPIAVASSQLGPQVGSQTTQPLYSWPLTGTKVAQLVVHGGQLTTDDLSMLHAYLKVVAMGVARPASAASLPALPVETTDEDGTEREPGDA